MESMALRSMRRDRENQIMDTRLERARLNWTRSANSHTGRRHVTAASEAGHMSAPDHAPCSSKRFFLRQRGRPHMSMMTISPGFSPARALFQRRIEEPLPLIGPSMSNGASCPAAQGGDEGGRLPVPMRDLRPEALTARRPAIGARHVRLGPGLIDEDQPCRIEVDLVVEPRPSSLQDVRTVLLTGVRGLFLRVIR